MTNFFEVLYMENENLNKKDEYIWSFGKQVSPNIVSHNISCFVKECLHLGYINQNSPLVKIIKKNEGE